MAAKRKRADAPEAVPADAKIARLMGLAAVKEMDNNIDKAVFLRSAGFSNAEIGSMLNIVESNVRVAFLRSKKKRKKRT